MRAPDKNHAKPFSARRSLGQQRIQSQSLHHTLDSMQVRVRGLGSHARRATPRAARVAPRSLLTVVKPCVREASIHAVATASEISSTVSYRPSLIVTTCSTLFTTKKRFVTAIDVFHRVDHTRFLNECSRILGLPRNVNTGSQLHPETIARGVSIIASV